LRLPGGYLAGKRGVLLEKGVSESGLRQSEIAKRQTLFDVFGGRKT
jgi:hypothetical protein